jgi:hypothetical protein
VGRRNPFVWGWSGNLLRGWFEGFRVAPFRPRSLAQVAGNPEKITPRACKPPAFLQATRHLQKSFLHQILHQFTSPMPPGKVARKISSAFGKEPFQVRRMFGNFHERKRQNAPYFPPT